VSSLISSIILLFQYQIHTAEPRLKSNFAASKEIRHILWDSNVHYRIHKSPTLSQINPVHTNPFSLCLTSTCLGALAHVASLLRLSVCMSVRPHVSARLSPDGFSWNSIKICQAAPNFVKMEQKYRELYMKTQVRWHWYCKIFGVMMPRNIVRMTRCFGLSFRYHRQICYQKKRMKPDYWVECLYNEVTAYDWTASLLFLSSLRMGAKRCSETSYHSHNI